MVWLCRWMPVVGALILMGCAPATELPRRAVREFSSDSARRFVEFLASDELQGRNTPSPGLLEAARYIADAFQRWGLEPIGGSYWHEYELQRRDLKRDSLWLRIWRGESLYVAVLPEHAIPFPWSAAGHIGKAPLVVLRGQLDSAQLRSVAPQLRGAVVMTVRLRRGFRHDTATTTEESRQLPLSELARQLRRAGVRGLLVVEFPGDNRPLRPRRFPWPSLTPGMSEQAMPLQLPWADTAYPVAFSVGAEVVKAAVGSVEALADWLQRDTLGSPVWSLPGVWAELAVAFEAKELVRVPNVVGMLRGRRKPEEYVLIGAHYDHVGVMAMPGAQDSIYNGADDNASGTAGLMLVARALSQLRRSPERSIVFVAFSGEEKGLLGSRAFVQHPPLPLEHCVAMLNMDMIGRNHPDSLSIGVRPAGLWQLVVEQNQRSPRPFLLGREAEEFFGRSDHASFAALGIPVVFFFTGLHPDYHRPSDHADKLNYDKLSRVAFLAARVAWHLAQRGRAAIPML